jgi:hypothetical protein
MRPYWCGLGIRPATLQTAKRLSFSSVNGCLPRKNSIRGHTHLGFIFSQMECLLSLSLSLSLFLSHSFLRFLLYLFSIPSSSFRPSPLCVTAGRNGVDESERDRPPSVATGNVTTPFQWL